MKFRNLLAATAALSLVASPALARTSSNLDRVAAPVAQSESDLGDDNDGSSIIIALLAAAAVIVGIIIAADGGNDDPISA